MTVPVIDIAPCLQGGNRDKHEVARQILAACEELGLFYLAGHGVSVGLVAAARQAAVDFFALPTAQKRLVLRDANRPVRGYFPLDDDSLPDADRAALPNLLEAYVMGLPDVPDDPWYRGKRARFFYAENLYPARPEGFRETVDEYFHALKKLTGLLVKAMALALGHSESFFADRVDRPACLMRLVRYPAQTRPPRGRRMRIGATSALFQLCAATTCRGRCRPICRARGGPIFTPPPTRSFAIWAIRCRDGAEGVGNHPCTGSPILPKEPYRRTGCHWSSSTSPTTMCCSGKSREFRDPLPGHDRCAGMMA